MKTTIEILAIATWLTFSVGCVETTETRPDGTVIRSKHVEPGVLPFLGDAMRHQLRTPTKIQPTK